MKEIFTFKELGYTPRSVWSDSLIRKKIQEVVQTLDNHPESIIKINFPIKKKILKEIQDSDIIYNRKTFTKKIYVNNSGKYLTHSELSRELKKISLETFFKPRVVKIINLRFGPKRLTYNAIGEKFNVTRQRIEQLLFYSLNKLGFRSVRKKNINGEYKKMSWLEK